MEEQRLKMKAYNSGEFFRINSMVRYTNDQNDGRHVLFDVPESDDYHMYFVSNESLEIKTPDRVYKLNDFDLLIYKARGLHELTSGYMTGYVHCVFSGKCVEEILEELNLKINVIHHIAPKLKSADQYIFFDRQLEYVRKEFRKRKIYSELSSSCMLIEFLSLYSRNRSEITENNDLEQVKKVILYLLKNREKNIDVEALIKSTHLSKSHFYRLFKEYTGTSPLQFHQNSRITVAADYLVLYNMKIREVSERLGFDDPLYFSRLFKKEFGVSPKDYIKIHKTHSHIQDEEETVEL